MAYGIACKNTYRGIAHMGTNFILGHLLSFIKKNDAVFVERYAGLNHEFTKEILESSNIIKHRISLPMPS